MSTEDSCLFPHMVSDLYGVVPCRIDQLPQTCSCGEPVHYAESVTFWAGHSHYRASATCHQVVKLQPGLTLYLGPPVRVDRNMDVSVDFTVAKPEWL